VKNSSKTFYINLTDAKRGKIEIVDEDGKLEINGDDGVEGEL
jgi:hypothetical protein